MVYPPSLVPFLTATLNAILVSGGLPPDQNILAVTPMLKEPTRSVLDTARYRPIAVQDPLVLFYALRLINRLVRYLENHQLRGVKSNVVSALFALQHFVDLGNAIATLHGSFLRSF